MKKNILTLAVLLIAFVGFSQNRTGLTGPAYKNYKPWLDNSEPVKVYSITKESKLTGPEFKNKKPWNRNKDANKVLITVGSERTKLTGPAYKNYKPWRKND